MRFSKGAALVIASLALTTGTLAGPAWSAPAGSNDNSQASVDGVDGVPARGDGGDCAFGRLCLYTQPNFKGTRFDLYVCNDYRLVQWNGAGSAWNAQTVGTVASFKNREFTVLASIPGREVNGTIHGFSSYNFSPVWYAYNC
ncbi:peptidase inhibitor family I36 protein [Streptomyces sp. NPDC001288]|uniref:peptidase inhibitor family I36 protein n=1 Tax=unclassified Streptomyces TaxID=2593676 RepID=UPI00332A94E9